MFTSVEKLYVCCIKTREREKGGEREKETDLKLEKQQLSSRFELLVGLALNSLLTVISTAMKVQFASGAKNKFTALPRTRRNQIQISFMISLEKFLGWNFFPFHHSLWRLTLNLLLKKFHTLASSTQTFSPNWSEFRLRSEPMSAPKPAPLLQDLMRAYHKRAHTFWTQGPCQK